MRSARRLAVAVVLVPSLTCDAGGSDPVYILLASGALLLLLLRCGAVRDTVWCAVRLVRSWVRDWTR